MRVPVNRHTTITLVTPSTALPSDQPINEMDPEVTPCHSPTPPSMHIHTKLTHANRRAHRAARSHPASRSHTVAGLAAAQHPSSHAPTDG